MLRTTLALLLVAGGLSAQLAAPNSALAVTGGWKACAARPVPPPISRPVDPGLSDAVQQRVTKWRESRSTRYPGVSAAIRWDDGRLVTAVSGVADSNSGRKVSPGTPFALASVSKPFTAAVALLLDACGVMPLTTRASALVPYADVRAETTIEDLLRHEGGMSDWLTDKYTRMDWLISHPNGKVGAKTAVQNLLPRGEIGEFNYSNSSFTLVTIAAEKATGVGWNELMQTLLLKPLGLTETTFGPVATASRTHIWSRGKMRPFGQVGWGPTRSAAAVLRGAGDLFATPRDLVRFGELLWGDRLLEGSQTQLINGIANLTGLPWSYTIGTMMDRSWLGMLRTYGHTGGFSGVSTVLRRIPELGATIAVTANGMGTPNNYADDLAINLIDLIDAAAPGTAQAIAQVSGSGVTAAVRANPEPFALTPIEAQVCGDQGASGSVERWIDLGSGGSDAWNGEVTAMAELPSGSLLVAGRKLTRAGGVDVAGVAERDPATGAWSPLARFSRSDGGVADIYALSVDPTLMRLYVGGNFTTIRSGSRRTSAVGIAQLNLVTGRWSALGGGVSGTSPIVRTLSLNPVSGEVLATGSFRRAGGLATPSVAIWRPASGWGAINRSSAPQISGTIEAATLSSRGAISVSGHLTLGGSTTYIARWTPEEGSWRSIATSATLGDAPRALALEPGGGIIAGTGVSWYGTTLIRESALSGYGWERVGPGVALPRRAAWISALAATPSNGTLIGGSFSTAGGVSIKNLALWSPATLSLTPIGGGIASEPDALTSSSHALAYAALRMRGEPGTSGARCITAWAHPAAESSPTPSLTATRRTINVRWVADAAVGTTGWIAEARGPGKARVSCRVDAATDRCTIAGLTPGVRYSVTLRSYSIPAGPAPRSPAVMITTKR